MCFCLFRISAAFPFDPFDLLSNLSLIGISAAFPFDFLSDLSFFHVSASCVFLLLPVLSVFLTSTYFMFILSLVHSLFYVYAWISISMLHTFFAISAFLAPVPTSSIFSLHSCLHIDMYTPFMFLSRQSRFPASSTLLRSQCFYLDDSTSLMSSLLSLTSLVSSLVFSLWHPHFILL